VLSQPNQVQLRGKDEVIEESSVLLTRLIRKLPVESYDAPVELADEVATPMGSYQICSTVTHAA
jgi:hypothetical protein